VIPEGYEGVVLKKTGRSVVQRIGGSDGAGDDVGQTMVDEDDEADDNEEMQVVEQVAEFDHVVVWNHEVAPDPLEDPYTKGIEEWIGFSDAVCLCCPWRCGK
jgi:ribonuclease H2 subunit C